MFIDRKDSILIGCFWIKNSCLIRCFCRFETARSPKFKPKLNFVLSIAFKRQFFQLKNEFEHAFVFRIFSQTFACLSGCKSTEIGTNLAVKWREERWNLWPFPRFVFTDNECIQIESANKQCYFGLLLQVKHTQM